MALVREVVVLNTTCPYPRRRPESCHLLLLLLGDDCVRIIDAKDEIMYYDKGDNLRAGRLQSRSSYFEAFEEDTHAYIHTYSNKTQYMA